MESFYSRIRDTVSESKIDSVIVLGKGGTAQNLPKKLSPNVIVININDSERLYPGHFALIHRKWVVDSLKDERSYRAGLYITNQEMDISNHLQVPYFPFTEEGVESVIAKLRSDDLFITDFLFLTAMKLSMILSKIARQSLDVYFLGFDFNISSGAKGVSESDKDDFNFKKAFLQIQEHHFEHVLHYLNQKIDALNFYHVGAKSYSNVSVAGFKELFRSPEDGKFADTGKKNNTQLYEALKTKVRNGKTLIVAELTNNHVGDKERLLKMIRLSKEAGADLIKVQKRDVDSFYTKKQLNSGYDSPFGNTLGEYRRGVELTEEHFQIIQEECAGLEIPWFSTVLDEPSLGFLMKYDCPLIKLPSTISNHKNYIKKVAKKFDGDVVVSTGFTDKEYEDFVIENFTQKNRTLWLLQCSSSYPTPPEACQISVVRHYDKIKEKVKGELQPGYSSHDVGSLGCMLAVAAGARMVEKHVKLGNLDWVHFDGVAIDLYNDEFKNFVKDVRRAEIMAGAETKKIHASEHHKYTPNAHHN